MYRVGVECVMCVHGVPHLLNVYLMEHVAFFFARLSDSNPIEVHLPSNGIHQYQLGK